MRLSTLLILMCLTISMIPVVIIWAINGLESTSFLLITLIISVTFVVSIFVSYFITRPLVKLTNTIDSISKGKLDINLEPSEIYEINNLIDSLDRIMASLKLAIVKVGVRKDEIFEKSETSEKHYDILKESNLDKDMDYIVLIDENAKILDCKENVFNILGYTKDDILKMNMADIDLIESKESILNRIRLAREKGHVDFKTIHRKKNGESILVDGCIRSTLDGNKFKCIFKKEIY